MAATIEFYLERADECAAEAQGAALANVHERCLRAESAWRAMARRLQDAQAEKAEFAERLKQLSEDSN